MELGRDILKKIFAGMTPQIDYLIWFTDLNERFEGLGI